MNILQFYLFSQLLLNNTLSLEAITNTAATSVNTSLSAYVQKLSGILKETNYWVTEYRKNKLFPKVDCNNTHSQQQCLLRYHNLTSSPKPIPSTSFKILAILVTYEVSLQF